jgi:uncharacterized FlaG/YvyC family protein
MSERTVEVGPASSAPAVDPAPRRSVEAVTPEGPQVASVRNTAQDTADPRNLIQQLDQITAQGGLQQVRFEFEPLDHGAVVVKVRDLQTDTVIRQIPPEAQLEFSKKLQSFIGLLFDEKA